MKYLLYIFILITSFAKGQDMSFAFKGSATITRNKLSVSICYGGRKLVDKYTGFCLQVRRSSDNATQDIGFTTNGDLDTTALKSFVGSGDGYVTIWYDQSGNGKNVTQTTAANQPTIIAGGIIQRVNSKPSLLFNNSVLYNSSYTGINQPFTINFVKNLSSSYPPNGMIISAAGSPNTTVYQSAPNSITAYASANGPSISFSYGSTYIMTSIFNGGSSNIFSNNVQGSTANPGTKGFNTGYLFIGAYNTVKQYYINGYISEIMLFTQSLSSTDRQALEANQNRYYKIY